MPFVSVKELKHLRELEKRNSGWLSVRDQTYFEAYQAGYDARGLLAKAQPINTAHLDALDLVIDAFGLRDQYGDHGDDDGRGAQRFYDDLLAAKKYNDDAKASERIYDAALAAGRSDDLTN